MDDPSEIIRRKEQLIARCAAQRTAVAADFQQLRRPLAVVDRALRVARFLRAHPVLVGGAIAAVVAFERRTITGLVLRVLALWRIWRQLDAWAYRIGVILPRRRRQAGGGHVAD